MSENTLKPRIRFKDFTEDWEQCELSNKVTFFTGLTYSPSNVTNEYGTLVLRSSNVKNGEVVLENNVYVESDIVNSENVKEGDIIVVVRNGSRDLIGKHAQIKHLMLNTVIGAFMTGVRYNEPEFLNALLNTERFNQEIEKNLGATINQITTGNFKKMQFNFPESYVEQKNIGKFFLNIDDLITLHQRKYDKLVNVKKSLLDKMFPNKGAVVPEVRFAGFTVAWEQRKLGELGKAISGVGFPDSEQGGSCGVPFYKVSDMNAQGNEHEMTIANNYVTEEQIARRKWKPVSDVPAMFFAKVGAAVMLNRKRLVRSAFLLDNNTMAYSLKQDSWDTLFAKSLFETLDLTALVQVGALPSYNAPDVEDVEIKLPSLREQACIGTFLANLDRLITLHQRKLEKLENIKKAFLEKIFI